jgi:hypothetical protein
MHLKHFGDSYDIVKKSILQWLGPFGPWAAHPMFTHDVSADEGEQFSKFLGVPLVSLERLRPDSTRQAYFSACGDCRSVFLDPSTGVRLHRRGGSRSPEFVFGDELVAIASARPEGLVLAFDQSLPRGREVGEILKKLAHFRDQGLQGFAYVSHASFMVVGRSEVVVREARGAVAAHSGLPARRIVGCGGSTEPTRADERSGPIEVIEAI